MQTLLDIAIVVVSVIPMKRYSLQIAGKTNLHDGIHKAVIFDDALELVLYEDNKVIQRVSLSPDRASFERTLRNTKDKISLICQRLNINEEEIDYQQTPLPAWQKIRYKSLILLKIIYTMLIPTQWIIVYKNTNEGLWHKIIPSSDIFQADPFIIYKDSKYYVFYEELQFEVDQGYLKAAELDTENSQLINAKTILKLDYHLSYPQVFEENDQFYMIPESYENNSIDLFECTSFPYEWQKKQTLIDNIEAVDSTLLKTNEVWYLFTNEKVKGADFDDELIIYKSSDLFNQAFTRLYDQPVISDVKNARMAGNFIQRDGEIFRVSQNCGKRYGYKTNINKVLQIENGYKEEFIETMKPTQGALGQHTFNQAHDIAVADMEIPRFDFYSIKRFIGGNIKRFFEIILRK